MQNLLTIQAKTVGRMSLSQDASSDSLDGVSNDSGASPIPLMRTNGSVERLECLEGVLEGNRYENKDSLAHDLSFLATMPELCDVTFLVGEDRQPVCGVRAILAARSRVFRKMLYTNGNSINKKQKKKHSYKPSDGYIEKYDFRGQPTVIVGEFEPEVFKQLMEYTHTGSVMLQARTLLGLMNAADHYGLEELKLACIRFMEHCITTDTVCALLSSAEKYIQYKSTKILVQKMFEFVDQNAETIFCLGAFLTLPQHVVRIVMGREELHASETSKCEAALKWCIRYTDDHQDVTLKQAFEPFVDVIDFFQIPAKHLMQSVKPANVVDDAVILNALAYQADPKSVEHIKRTKARRTIASTSSPEPVRNDLSPTFRRVQSSGQPHLPAQNGTKVLSIPRQTRAGSVPAYESPRSNEGFYTRGDIHPIRVHNIRDRSDSQSSPTSTCSPLSPDSYQGSLSSLGGGGETTVLRDSYLSRKLTYNSLDTVVTLSSSKAVEV